MIMLTLSLLLWSLFRDKVLICQSCRTLTNVNDSTNRSGVTSNNTQLSADNKRRRSSSKTHSRRSVRRHHSDKRRTERYNRMLACSVVIINTNVFLKVRLGLSFPYIAIWSFSLIQIYKMKKNKDTAYLLLFRLIKYSEM